MLNKIEEDTRYAELHLPRMVPEALYENDFYRLTIWLDNADAKMTELREKLNELFHFEPNIDSIIWERFPYKGELWRRSPLEDFPGQIWKPVTMSVVRDVLGRFISRRKP